MLLSATPSAEKGPQHRRVDLRGPWRDNSTEWSEKRLHARARKGADADLAVAKHRMQRCCPAFCAVLPSLSAMLSRSTAHSIGDQGGAQCCQDVAVERASTPHQTHVRKDVGSRPAAVTDVPAKPHRHNHLCGRCIVLSAGVDEVAHGRDDKHR